MRPVRLMLTRAATGLLAAENPAGGPANYIFPLGSLAYDPHTTIQFQYLQFRPLYWLARARRRP